MDSEQNDDSTKSRVEIVVGVTEYALEFGEAQSLFFDPKLNHTPVRAASILKLRGSVGLPIDFRDDSGRLRAIIGFSDDECAYLTVFADDGEVMWIDTVRAEECFPDSPHNIIPKIRPMYRALAAAFMLFLLVLVPIMLIYPYAGPRFATIASLIIVFVVLASVGILILVRTWLKL